MSSESLQRPEWEIDRILTRLIGEEVRVAAEAFSPTRWNGKCVSPLIPIRGLILPDNSQVGSLPVYFEGRLRRFVRHIGVVYVDLEAPGSPQKSVDGMVLFRKTTAVILSGPATVQLAYPFQVEKLPSDADNYWQDLRAPHVQFTFPL